MSATTLILKVNAIANEPIKLPVCPGSYFNAITKFEATVKWGDNEVDHMDIASTAAHTLEHTYSVSGEYAIVIEGGWVTSPGAQIGRLAFPAAAIRPQDNTMDKITTIKNMKNFWVHGQGDFKDCGSLTRIEDKIKILTSVDPSNNISLDQSPSSTALFIETFKACVNLSYLKLCTFLITNKVTSIKSIFADAAAFNRSVTDWDTSSVTDMSGAFQGATSFNRIVNFFDTESVLDMSDMFNGATAFNEWLNMWNVKKVKNMARMFKEAESFNTKLYKLRPIECLDMTEMFKGAVAFNQDIGTWKLGKVQHMEGMFCGATSFNQDISQWDTSQCTSMSGTFEYATNFNNFVNGWKTGNVQNMNSMFKGATSFDKPVHKWDTSSVTDMNNMFEKAASFNQPPSKWDTSSVQTMSGMFKDAASFNSDIYEWDTSSVTNMNNMFENATNFNSFVNSWDTSAVTSMENMFKSATNFNNFVNEWDMTSVQSIAGMFTDAVNFNKKVDKWTTTSITDMSEVFLGASSFNQEVKTWDTSNVVSVRGMFQNATNFKKGLGPLNLDSVPESSGWTCFLHDAAKYIPTQWKYYDRDCTWTPNVQQFEPLLFSGSHTGTTMRAPIIPAPATPTRPGGTNNKTFTDDPENGSQFSHPSLISKQNMLDDDPDTYTDSYTVSQRGSAVWEQIKVNNVPAGTSGYVNIKWCRKGKNTNHVVVWRSPNQSFSNGNRLSHYVDSNPSEWQQAELLLSGWTGATQEEIINTSIRYTDGIEEIMIIAYIDDVLTCTDEGPSGVYRIDPTSGGSWGPGWDSNQLGTFDTTSTPAIPKTLNVKWLGFNPFTNQPAGTNNTSFVGPATFTKVDSSFNAAALNGRGIWEVLVAPTGAELRWNDARSVYELYDQCPAGTNGFQIYTIEQTPDIELGTHEEITTSKPAPFTLMFSTDTLQLYVYDGNLWRIFNRDT